MQRDENEMINHEFNRALLDRQYARRLRMKNSIVTEDAEREVKRLSANITRDDISNALDNASMSGDLVLINALREYALDMNKKNTFKNKRSKMTIKENEAKARREYLKNTDIKEQMEQMEQEWTKEDISYLIEIGKIKPECEQIAHNHVRYKIEDRVEQSAKFVKAVGDYIQAVSLYHEQKAEFEKAKKTFFDNRDYKEMLIEIEKSTLGKLMRDLV